MTEEFDHEREQERTFARAQYLAASGAEPRAEGLREACRFIAGPESFTCMVHWRPRLALTDTACIGVTRSRDTTGRNPE